MPLEDTIAETWSETFDLRFNPLRHVGLATEWSVTVSPKRVLTVRSTRSIEKTLLSNEHKRALGNFAVRDFAFCPGNLIDRAAEMNCASVLTSFSFPRNRRAQCVIDFENAGGVPKIF